MLGRRIPSLVGRAQELRALERRLDRAASGWGQFMFVEGEAGIGKTRLVEELASLATAAGFDVLRGASEELDVVPFAAVAQAVGLSHEISTLLGESSEDADRSEAGSAPEARYRVVEAITGRVEEMAVAGPVAVVVEDLQWADPSTVVALRSMMRRTAHVPAVVVGTLQPMPRGSELAALLDAVSAQETALHLTLGPLGEDAVDALLSELVGAPPAPTLTEHVQRAGGNPFFIIELVDALVEEGALEVREGRAEALDFELPSGRRQTLLRRLRPLSPQAHEALRIAAVLGSSFELAELAAVLGRSPVELAAVLEEAMAAGVVGAAGTRLAFRHELLREAIYAEIAGPIRAGLHLHAGRMLAQAGAPVLQVAEHMALGARPGDRQAVHWLHEGGRQVLSANPGVAAELFAQALALADEADPARPAITADLVTALDWSGRYAEAEALARETLAAPCEPALASALRQSLISALVADGRGLEAYQEVTSLQPDFSSPAGVRLQVEAAWARLLVGEVEGARATAEAARARAAHHDAGACGALVVLGFIALMGADLPEALARLSDAVARAEATDTADVYQSAPHVMHAGALTYADRLTEARAELERGRGLMEKAGAARSLPLLQLMSVELGFFAGDWDDLVAEAHAGFDLAEDIGNRQATAAIWSMLAVRAVYCNDYSQAAEALAQGETELAAGRSQFFSHLLGWARALYEEAQGNIEPALAILGNVWGMCNAVGFVCDQPMLGPDLVRLHLAVGQRAEAESVALAVEGTAARMRSAPARASALRCRGLAEDDLEALVEGVTTARTSSQPLSRGAACMDAAGALSRTGRVPEASALLEEALGVYERLGAAREVARAESALRALGVRRRRTAPSTPDADHSLTKTEAAVVALVAREGLTNRQVAERLFVSPRTVETHVAHVFGKLGLSSRAQLMLWSARASSGDGPGPAPPGGSAGRAGL